MVNTISGTGKTRFFQMELTKADRDPVDRREC